MSTPTNIIDGGNSKSAAKVTPQGQLVTGSLSFDDVVFKELAEANTAYNFYPPKPGCFFVITGIIAKADKQVSTVTDADVIIYEAVSDSTTTVYKTLFQTAMVQDDYISILPLNIKVSGGKYINAKTTDDDIHMTITGYYVPN